MKCCSTADRLKEIMQKRNLKQVDILNKSLPFCSKYNVKMNKSDISQYVSGTQSRKTCYFGNGTWCY